MTESMAIQRAIKHSETEAKKHAILGQLKWEKFFRNRIAELRERLKRSQRQAAA